MKADLSGKRVLLVIAPEEFRDEELLEPKAAFENAGLIVEIACRRTSEARGMLGAVVKPDLSLADVRPENYDACVIVGGMGSPAYLWSDERLHSILQSMQKQNKVLAAICLSGAVLARAGVLRGKKATVWPTADSLAALSNGAAKYIKESVVTDGNVVTADGPRSAGRFAESVLELISSVPAKT